MLIAALSFFLSLCFLIQYTNKGMELRFSLIVFTQIKQHTSFIILNLDLNS